MRGSAVPRLADYSLLNSPSPAIGKCTFNFLSRRSAGPQRERLRPSCWRQSESAPRSFTRRHLHQERHRGKPAAATGNGSGPSRPGQAQGDTGRGTTGTGQNGGPGLGAGEGRLGLTAGVSGGPPTGPNGASGTPQPSRVSDPAWDGWGDWSGEVELQGNDWVSPDGWDASTPSQGAYLRREARRRAAQAMGQDGKPRDEFLRPMIDPTGIGYRLTFDVPLVEDKIAEEFLANQFESRMGIRFAAILIAVPLVVGFTISRLVAEPFFEAALAYNPDIFHPNPMQRAEGGREVHRHELRLRMEAAVGRIPPLSDAEMQVELRAEAFRVKHELEERNKQGWLNLFADGTSASVLFGILCVQTEGRRALFSTISRFFSGLSDTAKAFLIIAGTDVFLGYHSEEGWTALIHLVTKHYGYEVEEAPIYVFVGIVPVVMDAFFKLWIFKGLNRQNPAAAVTLKTMDRH
eukprot:jgi/Botrbrau1/2547/Bobra.0079s0034.1